MKKHFLILSFLSLCFLMGCAASMQTASKVSYQQEGFTIDQLESGGLALLPIVAGSGIEGYRRPFGDALSSALDSTIAAQSSNMDFTEWQATLRIINDIGVANEYNEAITTYGQTSILDQVVLRKVGSALDRRYLLFINLGAFEQDSKLRYSAFSGSAYTEETEGVSAYAQVWDTVNGDVVWESVGSAKTTAGEYTVNYDQGNIEKYSKAVAKIIAMQLLK